jgi:hypothetical protein
LEPGVALAPPRPLSGLTLSASGMEHRLQPLRIPTGWTVAYNDLHEIDPSDVAEDDRYTFLKEDLLQMKQEHFNRLLDVGWYPSGNLADGAYGLVVYEGDFHGKLLFELRTADRAQLVAEVERLLQEVCDARL